MNCESAVSCDVHRNHVVRSRYHEACEGQCRATVRLQRLEPRAKTTEVEARVALVCAFTDDGRPLTGGTHLIWRWPVDWVACFR